MLFERGLRYMYTQYLDMAEVKLDVWSRSIDEYGPCLTVTPPCSFEIGHLPFKSGECNICHVLNLVNQSPW